MPPSAHTAHPVVNLDATIPEPLSSAPEPSTLSPQTTPTASTYARSRRATMIAKSFHPYMGYNSS